MTESAATELHTSKWIERLHEIVNAEISETSDLQWMLSSAEADALISLIAKQRNRIRHLTESRDSWRRKVEAALTALGKAQ